MRKHKQVESGGQGRGPAPPPSSARRLMLGGAETSPVPETGGQTDKHRWRERRRCFIYGPGDRPSPVSESLIYQAEEASHPLATGFPPSWTGAQPGSELPPPARRRPAVPALGAGGECPGAPETPSSPLSSNRTNSTSPFFISPHPPNAPSWRRWAARSLWLCQEDPPP